MYTVQQYKILRWRLGNRPFCQLNDFDMDQNDSFHSILLGRK